MRGDELSHQSLMMLPLLLLVAPASSICCDGLLGDSKAASFFQKNVDGVETSGVEEEEEERTKVLVESW